MSIFRDCDGVLFVDFLPCGTTINGPYDASLLHRLRSSIWEKRREKLVCFSATSSRHRICSQVQHHTGSTELNHRAYSSNIVSSDYYLF